ncbi:MAG TPA: hypothetical protein VMM92_16345 [Thermoanaerobaculia bacterium]|nr:hypothetical protein [Thermoanaerobaculia bacterium]
MSSVYRRPAASGRRPAAADGIGRAVRVGQADRTPAEPEGGGGAVG